MAILPELDGSVGVLDRDHRPVGQRVPCRFRWGAVPKGWVIEVEPATLDISGLGDVYYLAIYADTEEMMFTMPLVRRPVSGVNLIIGR
jgi:hypothetical protein